MLNNPDAFWGDLRKLGPFPTPKQEANTKDDRPYESLTDDELEARWDAAQKLVDIKSGLSVALLREIAILSADLSHERCVRLELEVQQDEQETPDEPYYDDRAHQMKRS
jgi:hypothetical protein